MDNIFMQYKSEKTQEFIKMLGKVIENKRKLVHEKSRLNFCNSYELDSSNLRRIEHGEVELKITMLLRISEALGVSASSIIKETEEKLGKDFHIIDL